MAITMNQRIPNGMQERGLGMKVYLSEYICPEAVKILKEKAEIVDNWDQLEELDGIVLRNVDVTRQMMEQAKKLKVIAKHGVGCNTIDLEAAKELGITVLNTPAANTNSVAELIVGLMLAAGRQINYCDAKTRKEGFARIAPPEVSGLELKGKTIGLIGMGNIARRAGEILKGGFCVKLVGYDPYCSDELAQEYGIEKYEELNDMLETADFVSISVPLTPSTRDLITSENFKHFKKNAVLINTARGGIVNEEDLYEALKNKVIRAAACDAFVEEPPNGKNKLMSLDNFCATPHIGADTDEALQRMGMEVVEEILNVLEGREAKHRVV